MCYNTIIINQIQPQIAKSNQEENKKEALHACRRTIFPDSALLAENAPPPYRNFCEALNVSESTIRRDLLELDRQGRVNKVHGGAMLPSSQFRADEPTMEAKETLAVSQKNTIAKAAAALIQADDFVYLDAGSTTLAVARAVSGAALDAHYVTNGIAHARLLAQKGCRVLVPGGLLRPQTEAIIGAAAMQALQQ